MRAAVLYGPRDVRVEDRETPRIEKPTDAVIRMAATCVCGSDLWPYRGLQPMNDPTPWAVGLNCSRSLTHATMMEMACPTNGKYRTISIRRPRPIVG